MNTSNHSSPREFEKEAIRRNSEIDQQIQAIGKKSLDPDEVIEKFNSRKSSALLEKKASRNSLIKTILEESPNKSLSDFDDWDVVSASELDLDGMDDPFKDKWLQTQKKYYQLSAYSLYKSYKLRPLIVKANDDLR